MRARFFIPGQADLLTRKSLDYEMTVRDLRDAKRRRASLAAALRTDAVRLEILHSRSNSTIGGNSRAAGRTTRIEP